MEKAALTHREPTSYITADSINHLAALKRRYGTAEDIAKELRIGRSTAYTYMQLLPKVIIVLGQDRYRCCELRLARGLWAMRKRGNPRFHDSRWQAENVGKRYR